MKVRFNGVMDLKPKINGRKFQVGTDYNIFINATLEIIKKGFWTDLASTGIFSPLNKTMYPAVLHDWLYYNQTLGSQSITRKKADKIFLQGMKTTKTNYFKMKMYYYGVRVGGWKAWNKYKNDRRKIMKKYIENY